MTAPIDGPTLRALRESRGVSLRQVAAAAGRGHSHFSKVERAEPGRPVTEAVMAAYETALGMPREQLVSEIELAAVVGPTRRLGYLARVAHVSVRGVDQPVGAMLSTVRGAGVPEHPHLDEVALTGLDKISRLLAELDGIGGDVALVLLPWAVALPADQPRVAAVIAALARSAATSLPNHRREVADRIRLLALAHATQAGQADLRASIIGDIAAALSDQGHGLDGLTALRLADGDERLHPDTVGYLKDIRRRCEAAPQ